MVLWKWASSRECVTLVCFFPSPIASEAKALRCPATGLPKGLIQGLTFCLQLRDHLSLEQGKSMWASVDPVLLYSRCFIGWSSHLRRKVGFGGGGEPKPSGLCPGRSSFFLREGGACFRRGGGVSGVPGSYSSRHCCSERSVCPRIPPLPCPLCPLFLVGQKTKQEAGDIEMAVGAFEPGTGGEGKGWAADKECFLKQKRKCWLGRRGKEAASCCWWWLFCEGGGVLSVP